MLRQLLYPFLPYRSMVFPILVLWLIVAPCWLAYRVYRHRTQGHPLSLRRESLLLVFVLYLAGLASATLTPNRSSRMLADGTGAVELRPSLTSLTCSTATVPPGSRARGFCVRNARGNVLLFFPLGILLPLVSTQVRFWRGMQVAMALSFGIELVQYLSSAWGSYRAADVNDFILNVVGASLGLAVVFLVRSIRGRGSILAIDGE